MTSRTKKLLVLLVSETTIPSGGLYVRTLADASTRRFQRLSKQTGYELTIETCVPDKLAVILKKHPPKKFSRVQIYLLSEAHLKEVLDVTDSSSDIHIIVLTRDRHLEAHQQGTVRSMSIRDFNSLSDEEVVDLLKP